jgi:hypothetical protein
MLGKVSKSREERRGASVQIAIGDKPINCKTGSFGFGKSRIAIGDCIDVRTRPNEGLARALTCDDKGAVERLE